MFVCQYRGLNCGDTRRAESEEGDEDYWTVGEGGSRLLRVPVTATENLEYEERLKGERGAPK